MPLHGEVVSEPVKMEPSFVLPIGKIPCMSVLNAELSQLPPKFPHIQRQLEARINEIHQKIESGSRTDSQYIGKCPFQPERQPAV